MGSGFSPFPVRMLGLLTRILHNNMRIRLLDTLRRGCQIHVEAVSPLWQYRGTPQQVGCGYDGSRGWGNQNE